MNTTNIDVKILLLLVTILKNWKLCINDLIQFVVQSIHHHEPQNMEYVTNQTNDDSSYRKAIISKKCSKTNWKNSDSIMKYYYILIHFLGYDIWPNLLNTY